MINYNFIIFDGKVKTSYLRLTEEEFMKKLWEWTYEDDLWDAIDESELLNNNEMLIDYILDVFVPENVFHEYEDDDLNCFAFTVSDEKLDVREFDHSEFMLNFIMKKVKEHYGL